ncbi:helix-turn-helix domain-containing protein [Microbacterium karelineae]|uniref:helix-turn-helix domain-containing protein n=1 Tax=Microbacterium karelineae TaxID=2654283 RepID=UPI0012EABAA9|nr:helix-turn-helix transcriptional regulator [Microbacterium karelineae]
MTNPESAVDEAAQMARRIEQAREGQDRSVAWLAEKSGFAYKTLRTRLYGKPEKFSIAELNSICAALDVPLEWVVAGVAAVSDPQRKAT